LRLVDPVYKTDTAKAFGFKQIIYEPFLGGGLITATAPLLIVGLGAWTAVGVAAGIMLLFAVISLLSGWTRRKPTLKFEE
jgi:ESS family glutamate:Na+ symporter